MEVFHTQDGQVAKFIHADGSETAIKAVPSQSSFMDPETGEVRVRHTDRNKYSVFVSSSVGCYLKCPMCHLTIKDSVYRPLRGDQILENLKEALIDEMRVRPALASKYMKLCWMGMGDALNEPAMVRDISNRFIEWVFEEGFAAGLDCVDLSTVMPRVSPVWQSEFKALREELSKWPENPLNAQVEQAELSTHDTYQARPPFRLFYSVHSAIQETRDKMAPRTTPVEEAISRLKEFGGPAAGLIFHQLFVEGLNDSLEEVRALSRFMGNHFPDNELRVLRYNHCDRSPWREWDSVQAAVSQLAQSVQHLKVQISAGNEVQAACGQFLVARTRTVERLRIPVVVR